MIIEFFENLGPVGQALIGGIFTWLCTVLGSAFVFFMKDVNGKVLAMMQGFAAGVMIAASFWSLLAPALEYAAANSHGLPVWLPVAFGFILGGFFLRLLDVMVPHVHYAEDHGDTNPNQNRLSRTTLLFLAVTIHNFPEGLAVGVAFAAAALHQDSATLAGAIALTIGIGIQNIPEGSALSLPIRGTGRSKWDSFKLGQASALVEPVGAVLGAFGVLLVTSLMPYALSFAAGAMIFVVVEELIPESQASNYTDLATLSLMGGFTIMMILDVALG
ncbi:ZIP family metal transporter [Ignavigranum ruoffiae]|nr:ZIP family metal transporter [Ignavigranum ruoffiae]UPQ85648.1 ZIP family metal transporter [Ignavigranum ruoffiae]